MLIRPAMRVADPYGEGHYGAPRGDRKHNGVDVECYPDAEILAVEGGVVTKIGYPYRPDDPEKGHLRYVQVTTDDGRDWRYFYVKPTVELHDFVYPASPIGLSQSLEGIWPGMTGHVHVEIKVGGEFVDPTDLVFS